MLAVTLTYVLTIVKPYVITIGMWHPIETAPKDAFILVYCPEDNTRWLAKWQGGEWYGVDEFGLTRTAGGPEYVTGWKVTHWAHLPAPPRPNN